MHSEQPATVVGESILITGSLSGDEDLIILGRVEGTVSLSRTLFVSTDGVVKADVAVENAVISGVVVGNVSATDCIQITETGRVVGDLQAPRIIITTGARVRGQVTCGEEQAEQVHGSRAAAASSHAPSRSISPQRLERLGLPARRPMAQPPVARAAADADKAAPASASARQPSDEQADVGEVVSPPRRAQSTVRHAKKAPMRTSRRD
jgi:cytoskeletal protein CcmA (bactofilin family)